ncbi:MAG: cupredoxin family copper-binding protein [Chloroflexi bacterium]|nr:cupredoxin family copper-binding protein [Chloroflexota bacterium]
MDLLRRLRRRTHWRALVVGSALFGLLPLFAACAPSNSIAATAGLPTPVPPSAVSTLAPARPLVTADPNAPGGPQLTIENFNFTPADITVAAGTVVTWTNNDDVEHTVTASDNSFGSKALEAGDTFSFTFSQAGSYTYFCSIHPFMTGRVTVQ